MFIFKVFLTEIILLFYMLLNVDELTVKRKYEGHRFLTNQR